MGREDFGILWVWEFCRDSYRFFVGIGMKSDARGSPAAITRPVDFIAFPFLPRDALQCKARSCYRMSSVRLSVRLSVCDVGRS